MKAMRSRSAWASSRVGGPEHVRNCGFGMPIYAVLRLVVGCGAHACATTATAAKYRIPMRMTTLFDQGTVAVHPSRPAANRVRAAGTRNKFPAIARGGYWARDDGNRLCGFGTEAEVGCCCGTHARP